MAFVAPNLHPAQAKRLRGFSSDRSVDIHCHCLPGLDDGPASTDDALALCSKLVDDGITSVIATPHQMGAYEGTNSAGRIREAVTILNARLVEQGLALEVLPGADVRVDDQLLKSLEDGEILTLADGGHFLLLELPHDTMIDLRSVIEQLARREITTIVSHPERHGYVIRHPEVVTTWLELGALLQVTCGSLLNGFGPQAEQTAWHLVEAGLVSLIASDAHDIQRRPPLMTAAIAAITQRQGHAVARRLCIENPARVVQGEAISPPRTLGRKAVRGGRAW